MSNGTPPSANDLDSLKKLLTEQGIHIEQLQANKETLSKKNQQLQEYVYTLQEQLNLALARRYAASSEKIVPDQLRLFDEAEVDTDGNDLGDDDNTITIDSHTRQKKRGRTALPKCLPRFDVIHELDKALRICEHDGQELTEIGEVISEQLDIIPAKIQVIRNIRKKYACRCGHCIKTAPLPKQIIPKSIASPGLLAHITVSKYQDGLPLYRQETIVQRIGVDIPRATMANWMIKVGTVIQPLINLLRDRLLSGDIINMDETTVQVLNEPNKTAQSKSYLWVQRGGLPDKPVILFDYDPSRRQTVPLDLLEGFKGTLQTDGYDGYNAVVKKNGLTHLGCWAHARRKFNDAVKAQGKNKKSKNKKHSIALRGLALIQKLYKIEKKLRLEKATAPERHATRQEFAHPILKTVRQWLDESLPKVPPKTTTGKALQYLNNQWPMLVRYCDDGRFEIDNNSAENAIRPFVVGRKNWLFSHSVKGVKASANIYSLIETAKANNLEPYAYLRFLFNELPKALTVEDIDVLLPGNCSPVILKMC